MLLGSSCLPSSAVLAETVNPSLGEPVLDASVLRGPEGTWYLTGTTSWNPEAEGPDFHNNRGVRVWSSKDLRAWKDEGFVWDLWKDPGIHHGDWQTELYPVPGLPPGERARGFTAPRLAHDGERFWITYSMNGYASGAMPGGQTVAGPYADTKLLAEAGGAGTARSDASLFVDQDGKRYLVWGGGMIAPLKETETLKKLKDNEIGFEGTPVFLPSQVEGFFTDPTLPEHGMPYGVSVFRDGDDYVFLYTATTLRGGKASEDAYIARAKSLSGPYGRPELLKAAAGRVAAFVGPSDKLWISSSAEGKPVLEPLPKAAKAIAATPPPAPPAGEIVTSVPRRNPSEKPSDVAQLLETIEPVMDHPLRDAALAQGPDGTWYMTGTEATRGKDGKLDWANNRGIRLWSSPDRKTWTDRGYVWEFERNGNASEKGGHLDLTIGASPQIGRAITAPEIHFLKGTFWIPYSVNGMQSGLLKSTSGKAEGPYENVGIITRTGRDPSLFQDGDTVFWVLGNGLIAKMKDDMSGLAEAPHPLFTGVKWNPRYMRRLEVHGIWGSHLRKQGDWYVWVFTTRTGRGGINAIDTMATWSKSLEGPWAEPCLMLANGGQSTLVPDGKGGWLATVSGEDEMSNHPFRACITPVVSDGELGKPLKLRPLADNAIYTNWQMINSWHATALDLWKGYPDLIPNSLRDIFILRDRDGTYYCTGSFWGEGVEDLRRDAVFFKSKDLLHWEKCPPVYSYSKLAEDGMIEEKDLAGFKELVEKDAEGTNWRFKIQIGEQKIWPMGDTYYMNAQAFCKPGGHLLLKSTSGKIEGPYKPVQWIGGTADLMQEDDGAILLNSSGIMHRRFASLADFENTPMSVGPKVERVNYTHAEKPFENIIFTEDCEAGLMKIGGKYVTWSTDWTGNYDCIYRYADRPEGPYHGKMRILPHGGNGKFFQDEKGQWFYTYFFNTNDYASRKQNYVRMNMYPVFVGEEDGELIIEPVAVRENRSALEKMGAIWQPNAKPLLVPELSPDAG